MARLSDKQRKAMFASRFEVQFAMKSNLVKPFLPQKEIRAEDQKARTAIESLGGRFRIGGINTNVGIANTDNKKQADLIQKKLKKVGFPSAHVIEIR